MEGLPPGATIGILGGGQLGRMTAMAVARLGFRSHIFCQADNEPAAQVATSTTVAPFLDDQAVARFADAVDVATIEFENIPLRVVEWLAQRIPVRPNPRALAVAQDRRVEKSFFGGLDIPIAPFAAVTSVLELRAALQHIGTPALLKTATLGYDGKGQVLIDPASDIEAIWRDLATNDAVLEAFLDLDCEVSVIIARAVDGTSASFDPAKNEHREKILHRTTVPARIPPQLLDRASAVTRRIADALDLVGLLAVEFFVTAAGQLVANEMAPRPHNSGHWTLDACAMSQFEQLVRAVSGHPLGDPARHSNAEMINLLGRDLDRVPELLADPRVCLHLYGKADPRPGRKMGHATTLLPFSTGAA